MIEPIPGEARRGSSVDILARTLSTLGHPAVILPITVAVGLFEAPDRPILPLVLVLLVLGVIGGFILWGVRRGRWEDIDVSNRQERTHLYKFAIGTLVVVWLGMRLFGPQGGGGMRGFGTAAVLMLAGQLINRRIKVSLHTAFSVFAAFIVYPQAREFSLGLLAFAPLVAWSRIVLRRHTLGEVFFGAALGLLAGLSLLLR